MAILNHGSTIRTADGGQSTTTIVTASNIGSYAVASNATYYIGTTQNVFNRASGAQTLTGVSIDGNAASATVLQTARTIGGVSFNGSANINLPGVNTAGNQNTTGTSSNITAYTINQNVGTSNTPSFAGIVSSGITNYAFLQVTDSNNFWITPGNNNWGLYFETSAGGLLGGSGDSNRLGFVGAGAARFYVDLNNGNGWFGASLTANTDSRSPIFYDSNNTAYYIDAASTSVINALSVSTLNNINAANGTWHTSSEGKARFYFASNGTTYFRTGNDYVFRNNSDIGVVVIDSVGNLRTSTSGDNSPSYSLHVGGTGFASADFRAPIFYDSGNTAYYLDPANTGTSLLVAGNVGINTTTANNKLTIQEVGTDGTPPLRLITTSAPATFSWFMSAMNSSLTAGKNYIGLIGQAESQNNSAYIGFNYQGAGSTSNFLTFGFYQNDNLLNLRASGNVGIGTTGPSFKLDVNGTVRIANTLRIDGFDTSSAQRAIGFGGNTLGTNGVIYSNGSYISISAATNQPLYLNSDTNGNILISGTSSVGIGTASPSQKLHVVGTGFASSDFRTPIFYDSDDTTYYLDPANTSLSLKTRGYITINNATAPNNLAMLNIGSSGSGETRAIDISGGWSGNENKSITFTHATGSTNIVAQINAQHNGPGSKLRWGKLYHGGDSSTYTMELISESTTSAYLTVAGSVRSPIFYDSDNTSYYINAAGASSLNTLTMAGIITTVSSGTAINFSGQSDSFGYNATAGQGTYIKGTGSTYIYGGGVFYDGSAIRTLLHSNNYSGYSTFSGSVTSTYGNFTTPGLIMGDAQYGFYVVSGNVYYKSASGGVHYWRNIANNANTMSLDNSGILTVAGNLSAPIFYDSNDTAYYVDPNSVSRLASLRVYSAFDTASSDVYANMRVMRNNATTDGMYIGYGNSGTTAALTRIFGGGATTGELSKYSTYTLEPGSFRSPIFYDSDNTGYYLDAASTSNLNILGVAGRAGIGGAGSRSTNGLTVGFTDNSTFAANTDVGDTDRMLSIVNESSTTNAMAVLGFRVNPNGGTANAMLDVKFVQTGATNTSALHYTFNHGGSFADRFSILSSGNVGIGTISPTQVLDVRGNIKLGADSAGNYVYYVKDNEGFIIRTTRTDVTQEGLFRSDGWGNFTFNNNIGVGLSLGTGYGVGSVGTGIVYANGSIRAPIFYDSDNTSYYTDPSSLSNILELKTNKNWYDSSASAWGGGINMGGNNPSIGFQSTASTWWYMLHHSSSNINFYRRSTSGSWNHDGIWDSSGNLIWQGSSVRAPIFYDQNNTAYYCDPNSTSNFVGLTVANTITGAISGNAGTATTLATARTLTIGSTGKTFNGSADVSWSTTEIVGYTPAYGNAAYQTKSLDTISTPGLYQYDGGFGGTKPPDNSPNYRTIEIGSSARFSQIAMPWNSDGYYFRRYDGTSFSTWRTVLHDGNYNSYAPTLTGTGASGSWGISVTGSSASCTGNSATTTLATKATRANGNFYIDDNYGNTVVGLYSPNRYQGVFTMGDAYKLTTDGTGVGNLYGIAWSHPNAGGAAGNLSDHGALILLNGGYAAAISSSIRCTADMRTPIYYDSNDTAYYLNPNGGSSLVDVTANEFFARNWFRNNDSGEGIYNQTTTQHFYSDDTSYWNVASSSGVQGIRLRTGGYAGTVRGYFYANNSNDVGLLNNSGNWRARVVGGDYFLADGSSIRGQIFYDSNDTNYYCDPNGTSSLAAVNANAYYPHGGITESDIYARSLSINAYHHGDSLTYDTFQFNAASVYETRATVGSSFVSSTVETSIFRGDRFGGMTIANNVYQVRWTWNGTIGYRFFKTLYISNSTNGNSFTVTIESSANGSTWTTIATTGAMSNWPGHSWYNYFWNNNATIGYIRITVTPTWVNANTMDIYSMRYFCSYALDAGARLYDWDYNRNVTFPAFVDATQFRDTNNTAYYIDAASTSNLVGLTVANTITGSVSGNAVTAGGLAVHSGRNNEVNKIVRTDSDGYIQAGWINTTSGNEGTTAIDRVYASYDGFIRYYTPANFRTVLDVPTRDGSGASGSWGISVTGSSASCTGNSATATILATARTIGGVSFNGSANIDLPGVNTAGNQNTSGNAATVTNGVYTGTTNTLTGVNYFRSDKGSTSTVGTSNTYALQAFSNDAGAAGMSFHRGGYYAVNMGLDPDNILRIGGWSASANRLQLDMSGNLTVAGAMYGTNFIDSDNTAYFCNPASTSNLNGLTTASDITVNGITIGKGAGNNLTNSAFGINALSANTGNGNSAFGYHALRYNTTGFSNTGVGRMSLRSNTSGVKNTAVGRVSLFNNTTGIGNSAFGYDCAFSSTYGSYNSAFGTGALRSNTYGNNISCFGYEALRTATAADNSSAFGFKALRASTSFENSAFGSLSMTAVVGGSGNSAFGHKSLFTGTSFSSSSAFGSYALGYTTTGTQNSAFGTDSLRANTSGSYNCAFGRNSGRDATTGSYNSFFGYNTGRGITTGSNNTVIGSRVGSLSANLSNNIIIADGSGNKRISVDSSGNTVFSGIVDATQFRDSSNTAFLLDPASTSILNAVRTRNTYGERVSVTSAASTTIDTQYNLTELTMAAFITTLTFSNIQSSGTVHMWTIVTLGNGSATSVTWPAAIKWPGGTAPNITGTNTKRDIYQFVTYDGGTNIYAIIVGQNL